MDIVSINLIEDELSNLAAWSTPQISEIASQDSSNASFDPLGYSNHN